MKTTRSAGIDTNVPPDPAVLPLTGERTVPGIPEENYWFRRHEAAYLFATPLAERRIVLEVGCGEGYGTAALSVAAEHIVGIDYDSLTIQHASASYPGLDFARANLAALPVRSGGVDLVATLQVIEHVWNHPEFVRECLRVLRPGGTLLVTTPNRLTFSPGLDEPVNPFHTKEFTATELIELLTGCGFDLDEVFGLHAGPRITELDARYRGSFVDAQIATPSDAWGPQLRADVASVRVGDFPILAADVHDVDQSLDLIVLARRPSP